MNRYLVGSGVGSSGEGVCALSSSLVEIILPSDEPTLQRFSPAVHPVLKENHSFTDPCSTAPMHLFSRPSVHPMLTFTAEQNHSDGSTDTRFFLVVGSSGATLTRWSHLSYLFGATSLSFKP
jgi:hypothetical protein